MCINSDGDYNKAFKNTAQLAAAILIRRGWGLDKLKRHYDASGKN